MKSWVQEQKDKIDKYYKDLNARIKVLTHQRDTLTTEVENIKQIRHSLEPLRKEVANLQKSKIFSLGIYATFITKICSKTN